MRALRPDDRAAFILAQTRLSRVPHAPEIVLHLADEAMDLWQATEDELETIGLPPPFWAFAWAGGQALARYVLDHPDIVRGRKVLDFASGSGLVAIAAARAGAGRVEACDIDDFAQVAIGLNAAANGVAVHVTAADVLAMDVTESASRWDVVLAGDIAYEADMAARCLAWLASQAAHGCDVLIGDPGRTFLPKERLNCVADYSVPVTRALEDMSIKRTQVWRFRETGIA